MIASRFAACFLLLVVLLVAGCGDSKETAAPVAEVTSGPSSIEDVSSPGPSSTQVEVSQTPPPTATPSPEPEQEEGSYPGAQKLDISAVNWGELAPSCLNFSTEAVLDHQAWRSEDLPPKIFDYYNEYLYNENWERTTKYLNCPGPWSYASYKKGDDFLGLAVLGNLSSAHINEMPDIGLKPADSLILMAVGNPFEGYIGQGRLMLEQGDLTGAWDNGERALQEATKAGFTPDDPQRKKVTEFLEDVLRQMTPVDVAILWFRQIVNADVFGPGKEQRLEAMKTLGLVKEYPGSGGTIIDSYTPSGEWTELSNDGTVAVVEFKGIALGNMTNRLSRSVQVANYDYKLQLTLNKNESGFWEPDFPASVVLAHEQEN